jgi:DtxR family Mn-dependent transcriptional regulator
MVDRNIEEVLEALWTCGEKKDHRLEALRQWCHISVDEPLLTVLEQDGLIAYDGNMILLTSEGRKRASQVVRRHRLAERLLVDVLNMPIQEAEKGACEFEHVVAPEVTESICTLLGHPRQCPHGAAIPHGKCCLEAKEVVDNVVVPLTRLEAGTTARIAYISTRSHPRLHKLLSFGLAPGMTLTIHQKFPSYVVTCAHAELALEQDVAGDIHVWKDGHDEPTPGAQELRADARAARG